MSAGEVIEYVYEIDYSPFGNKPDVVYLYRIKDKSEMFLVNSMEFLTNSMFSSASPRRVKDMREYIESLKNSGAEEISQYIIKNKL